VTELDHSALIPLPAEGTELALPDALVERAKDYASQALAERSRAAYQKWWARFEGWAECHGRQAMPASPESLAAWIVDLADGATTGRPLAKASINQAIAAVVWVHRNAGHSIDRKARAISLVWAGVSRTKAMTQPERQAAPFMAADVADLLAILNVKKNIGCRNAALLTLGFGAALRRSELVGLDWGQLGTGTGWVVVDERGILITLARSKASQDKAQTVVIPRADFEPACAALEAWAGRAQLEPGEPIYRSVNNRHVIAAERLTAHSVSRIVKKAMRDIARKRGKTIEEAKELVRRYSGHSLRAGFVTSAAAVDVPALRIAGHTRHASLEMVSRYCREADKYSRSALKGVFRAAEVPE
jgi:integrase